MKKFLTLCLALGLLAGASAVIAGNQSARTKYTKGERFAKQSSHSTTARKPGAAVTIDYFDTASVAFYFYAGNFYMSNLFVPAPGSWPLVVNSVDVLPGALDGVATSATAGVLNGVAVFDVAGNVLARELNVNAVVGTWTTIPLTTPPVIPASANFYAGLWNSYVSSSARNDAGLQGSAMNWTAPPTEPFASLGGGGTVAAAGPYTVTTPGSAYPTVSAASVRVNINTNTPVELMRFRAE